MTRFYRQVLTACFKLFDVGIMVVSFVLATVPVLQPHSIVSFAQFLALRVRVQNILFFGCLLVTWHMIFTGFGLYQSKRLSSRRDERADVVKATSTFAALLILMASSRSRINMVTPIFVATFWSASTLLVVSSRSVLRYLLGRRRAHGRNLRSILVVGTNSRARGFAKMIESKPELGYRLSGFVDDEWTGIHDFQQEGYSRVASLDDFSVYLRSHAIDEVAIALPVPSYYLAASRIVAACEEQGVTIRFLSNIFHLRWARQSAEDFGEAPIISLYTGPREGWPLLLKRILDIAISLILILVSCPVFLVIALLIKLTTGGPILFLQDRVGRHKRTFRMYKFRTMVPDAERKLAELGHLNEVSGPVFKIRQDPRLTPIGKFLRKTSIDELPQLWNVLKGDMSLVGPRPLPLRDYQGFDQDWQRRRFSVPPGITCLWQIHGRSSLPFERWMELDMHYIDHWSLWLDLQILARTIPAVLKGTGAA